MKSRSLIAGMAVVLVIAACLLLFARKTERAPKSPESGAVSEMTSGARMATAAASPSSGVKEGLDVTPGQMPLDDRPREDILEEIEQLSVSYDAKELPKIEPYLLHPDAEVRKAALNGMIALGDSAAAPLLRKAAAKAPTPQEAVSLIEAADFMELPEGSFISRDRTKEGTRVPKDADPDRAKVGRGQ